MCFIKNLTGPSWILLTCKSRSYLLVYTFVCLLMGSKNLFLVECLYVSEALTHTRLSYLWHLHNNFILMILMRKQILREFKWVVQVTLLELTLHLSFYDKSLLLWWTPHFCPVRILQVCRDDSGPAETWKMLTSNFCAFQ